MKVKRKYTRRTPPGTEPFVVYVTFPNSIREYCYLCNIPGIRQGDTVMANGAKVLVQRTASHDRVATRFVYPVPDADQINRKKRIEEIVTRLRYLHQRNNELEMWAKLANKNTEAKGLYAELKKLIGGDK